MGIIEIIVVTFVTILILLINKKILKKIPAIAIIIPMHIIENRCFMVFLFFYKYKKHLIVLNTFL